MRKFVFLSVLLFLCIVCQVIFFIYVVVSYDRRVSRFRVEERLFRDAVEYACTNYLASYLIPYTNSVVSSPVDVDVIFVRLSTWGDYYGRYGCLIDGARYGEGDYSPYGKIVKIGDGRVYCQSGGSFCILRASNVDDSSSRPRPGARSAPGEDGEDGRAL